MGKITEKEIEEIREMVEKELDFPSKSRQKSAVFKFGFLDFSPSIPLIWFSCRLPGKSGS